MRKTKLFSLMAAALLTATTAWADVNADDYKLPGAFSVSATKVVYFSQGNLQYTKSTGKWKIMDHQYDMVETLSQNVGTNYASQDVVTLFGWGTSGWESDTRTADFPYYTNNNNADYGVLATKSSTETLTDATTNGEKGDWGVFNSGDLGAGWRTLTNAEWGYLFNTRTPGNSVNGVSNARYTEATINTDGTAVNGIILFPDDADMTSVSGVTWGSINSSSSWGTKCTSAGWTALETAGCVFLPAAGRRNGTSVGNVGSGGFYWSSSAFSFSALSAYFLYFYSDGVNPQSNCNRYRGCSVRLVSDEAPVTPATVTAAPTAISGLIYNGSAQALINAGTASGGTMNYSLDNSTWSTYIPTATDADDYTVYYKVVGDASHTDYTPSPNTVAVTIAKAALTIQADDSNLEYGDPAWWCKKATYTGFVNGEDVTVLSGAVQFDCEYTDGGNVGTYSITPYGVTADNYEITFVPGTVTVNKAASSVTAAPTAINNLVYTGAAQTLVNAGTAAGGTMWYSVDGGAYSTDLPQATVIGNHTVYYKVVGDANHNDVTEASLTATIYMQITARPMAGADMLFNVLPDYTVNALKLLIAAEMGCPAEQLRLVFAGKQLEDGRTLGGDYNIQHQCVIMVIRRVSEDITANIDPDHAGTYYSTYYNSEWKFMLPEGVEAYIATVSGETLLLTKIAEEGEVIPADNAVILKANVSDFTLSSSYADPVTFDATNNLRGVDAATAAPSNCYVLSGHSSDSSVQGVGFYQFSGTLAAHKAYVVIGGGGSMAPKRLRFVFNNENTATGVENVQSDNVQSTKVIENGVLYIEKNGVRYNAQGQIVK